LKRIDARSAAPSPSPCTRGLFPDGGFCRPSRKPALPPGRPGRTITGRSRHFPSWEGFAMGRIGNAERDLQGGSDSSWFGSWRGRALAGLALTSLLALGVIGSAIGGHASATRRSAIISGPIITTVTQICITCFNYTVSVSTTGNGGGTVQSSPG